MARPLTRVPLRAAAAAAGAAVLVAGCASLRLPAATQPHHHPATGARGSLITEPGDGFSPVYRLIARARHSIDLTMFELSDLTAEHDLAAAARRGVRVRVVLDQRERSTNTGAYNYLTRRGVRVAWSSPRYEYTHQKTLVIDRSKAVIMTANLTSQYYPATRDFLVTDSRRADVAAITRVFRADYARRPASLPASGDLVWSPGRSGPELLSLISSARTSLRVYSEEMSDAAVESALAAAARRGVTVRVCGENRDGEYDSAYAALARAGVRISYYDSPHGFYIHAKAIEADYGTARGRAFVGSENFSVTSLSRNRELGVIISRPAALASLAATFGRDFRNGNHWRA